MQTRLAARASFFSLALAGLLSACLPQPGGQCRADSDCGYSTTCQAGLCRQAPLPPPQIGWVSPEEGSFHAAGPLAIAFSSEGAEVALEAISALDGRTVGIPIARAEGGLWRAVVDTAALRDGPWTLAPRVGGRPALPRLVNLDRTGPGIGVTVPTAPRGAFLRSQTIRVTAAVTDAGSGVDDASVALLAAGAAPIAGRRISAHDFEFALPLSAPVLNALAGDVALRVIALDRLGNPGSAGAQVPVTRLVWRAEAGRGLPVRSSPVLDGARVYLGTDGGRVLALDRRTGVQIWSQTLGGPVSASPVRGQLIYAASEAGEVIAIEPGTGEVRWNCADPARRFLASPALGQTSAGETLFLTNASALQLGNTTVQGGVFAVAQGFPGGACAILGQTGGGRSSVAIAVDGTLYVGGGKALHALRFEETAGSPGAFRERWSAPAGDDVSASPALAAGAVLSADEDGGFSWLSPDGAAQGVFALGEKLLASPVFAFGTGLAQGRDGTLAPVSARLATTAPTYVAQQLPAAGWVESTPAVGADGTVYVAAGRTLRALAPGGALLWEAPLAGVATASSPVLGCDGTLYLGDSSGSVTALATDSKGLADGGWPRFRHDPRGTGNASSPRCEE